MNDIIICLSLILFVISACGCAIWSNTDKNSKRAIIASILCGLSIAAFLIIVGCNYDTLRHEKTQQEGNFEVSEVSQETASPSLEEQLEMANKKIEIAKAESEAKKIQAEGEAEAMKITAEGEAEAMKIMANAEVESNAIVEGSITSDILLKMLIEKWNGKLPETVTLPIFHEEED